MRAGGAGIAAIRAKLFVFNHVMQPAQLGGVMRYRRSDFPTHLSAQFGLLGVS